MQLPFSSLDVTTAHVETVGFTVGVFAHRPFPGDVCLRAIGEVSERFPFLQQLSVPKSADGADESYSIRSNEEDWRSQCFVKFTGNGFAEFGWGPKASFSDDFSLESLLSLLQKSLSLNPVNAFVSVADVRATFHLKMNGNLYEAVRTCVLHPDHAGVLFSGKEVRDNDMTIRGMLREQYPCIVQIRSNIGDDEIDSDQYEDDRLVVTCGVAKSNGFSPRQTLADVISEVSAVSEDFAINRAIPHLVYPIDAWASRQAAPESEIPHSE